MVHQIVLLDTLEQGDLQTESLECLGYLELFGLLGYYTLRHDVMRTNELGDSKRSAAITLRVRIA